MYCRPLTPSMKFHCRKPYELIRSMINYEMWSCAVCPIKRRWRVPRCPILSWWPVLEASSQTRCIFIPAAVHLYTSPYKTCVCVFVIVFVSLSQIQTQKYMSIQNLVPSCSNLCSHFSTLPALDPPQKKDIVTSRLLHNNHFPNDRFPNNNHIRPIPCLFNWLTCLQNANESKS